MRSYGAAVKEIIFTFAAGLLLKESVLKTSYCSDARRVFLSPTPTLPRREGEGL